MPWQRNDDDDQPSPLVRMLSRRGAVQDDGDTAALDASTSTPRSQAAAPAPQVPTTPSTDVADQAQNIYPDVPKGPAADWEKYADISRRKAQDSQQTDPNSKDVKPRWWERLGGAAVGFGLGWNHDPNAIAVGSSVTNRRYNQAEAQREGRLRADESEMADWRQQNAQQQQDFGNRLSIYNANIQQSKARREQGNADRVFGAASEERNYQHGRDAKQDQRNDRRDTSEERYRNWEMGHQDAGAKETGRHNRAEESIAWARLNDDRKDKKASASAAANERRDATAAQIREKYTQKMSAIEHGDKNGGLDYDANDPTVGFQGALQNLQTSAKNPRTNKPWKPGEQDAAIAQLKQVHAERKNFLQQGMESELGQMGVKSNPVRYDQEGRTISQGGAKASAPAAQQTSNLPPTQQASQSALKPKQQGAKLTDKAIAQQYVQLAGGDKAKARALANQDGWKL